MTTAAPLTLYSYWRSTTSYRVRAALNLKGVAYDIVPVDLVAGAQRAESYTELNPGQGVPTLVLADGTVLTQSLAILDYIEATWPDPALLPADPVARARVLAAAHTMALDVHPVNNLRVVTHLRDAYDAGTDGAMDWMRHWMTEGFAALDALVRDDTPFAFGTAPDLADLCIVAQVYNARRWGVDLDPFPNVARIEAACLAHQAIAAAHPDQQPDAS
ncbi:maleylacetoacetate isomerase [uncultured Tateyamaria sp.]|uniref:maleylacetoacetate isomerase n=1 Tax=uncultured Tateyamaria sp. TaxID=455651 RepID=UPI002613518B|nr:maleylacetoacetate isomerase [uncultured Tateyamaria sp.]